MPPVNRVVWEQSFRLIPSKYPPIDLFDDIADPADWDLLAAAESKTNPRVYEQVGEIGLVPVERRVSGDGASWVMGAFTHISTDRTTRFSDGSYGVYYCANDIETALRETAYHQSRFLSATNEDAGWIMEMREWIAEVNHDFHDIRGDGYSAEHNPDDYKAGHALALALRADGSNGLVYSSVRNETGECLAAFWPDVIGLPIQGGHWHYHWNGEAIDQVKKLDNNTGESEVYRL